MAQSKSDTRRLTTTAILIAVSVGLAFISGAFGLRLPFGGSFTIASMLPLILISYLYGVRWGLVSAFVYALLQMLVLSYGTVSAFFIPGSDGYQVLWKALLICLMDYILAYTVVGFGGVLRGRCKKTAALVCGTLIALSLRYAVHILSGALFFGEWATWFFAEGDLPQGVGAFFLGNFSGASLSFAYSVVYNGLYMLPEIVITMLCAGAVSFLPQIRKRA